MKITEHFTLEDLTYSAKAVALGIKNEPDEASLQNLKKTAERLEKIRAYLCQKYGREVPISISSGFRNERVNREVKGARNSAHKYGSAADISADGLTPLQLAKDIIEMRRKGLITYDQLIKEPSWVHFGCRHNSPERDQIQKAWRNSANQMVYQVVNDL